MYLFLKRLFDFFFALASIFVFSPVLLIIACLLLVFNKGDIIYFQERYGLNNKKFYIYKFSSMLKNSPDLPGGLITIRNDPRVTKIGRILRFTKLNEIPQLFNVLFGDMSFVGPRPLTSEGFKLFSEDVQSFLYKSKPGITGISSLVFRDEEKYVSLSKMSPELFYQQYIFPYKDQLEKWYYVNRSFRVDIIIITLTIIKVMAPNKTLVFKVFKSLPKSTYFSF